jgi:hypothetical protein
VQVAPALFLLSSRLDDVAPLPGRAGLALAYLLIPSFELDANLTNAQWHLAVLATLVVVARARRGWTWRGFDVVAMVLSALTGPFGFLLILLARQRWTARGTTGATRVRTGQCQRSIGSSARRQPAVPPRTLATISHPACQSRRATTWLRCPLAQMTWISAPPERWRAPRA